MFGLPATRIQTHEVSVLGSAMVVFTARGIFSSLDEAMSKMVYVKDEFTPDMDEHKTYMKLYDQVFTKIFDKLLPLYKKGSIYKNKK